MNRGLPVVVLVGRPNVGKSTLFNRLTASRDALVADVPGVTRDRRYGLARSDGRRFLVVDTGGLGLADPDLDRMAEAQTDAALAEADAVVLVLEAGAPPLAGDAAIAAKLRRLACPVYALVNKSEGLEPGAAVADFHALGLGAPFAISATHGDRVQAWLAQALAALPPASGEASPDPARIRLAVLGRPNAGKSTLANRLLGAQRMLTMDAPGTTRDAIAEDFEVDGERYTIVDTAGIRRRARIEDALEKFSVIKAMQAAEASHVVLVMIDARAGLGTQDARLLQLVLEQGRATVIVVNKWDGLAPEARRALREDLHRRLGHLDFLRTQFISALHGSGLAELLAAVREAHAAALADLPTPALSEALRQAVAAHAPPAAHGGRIKLRYAHQGGRNPPRIVIHGNRVDHLPDEYRRYLARRFRRAFDLTGTPLEIVFRSGDNPFAHKAGKAQARRR